MGWIAVVVVVVVVVVCVCVGGDVEVRLAANHRALPSSAFLSRFRPAKFFPHSSRLFGFTWVFFSPVFFFSSYLWYRNTCLFLFLLLYIFPVVPTYLFIIFLITLLYSVNCGSVLGCQKRMRERD